MPDLVTPAAYRFATKSQSRLRGCDIVLSSTYTIATMEPSKAALKAALRVLTALNERQAPDQVDVDELHWYAPADCERPIDELVCDAIQRALKDREQKRQDVKVRLRAKALSLESAPADTAALAPRTERDRQLGQLVREHAVRRQ